MLANASFRAGGGVGVAFGIGDAAAAGDSTPPLAELVSLWSASSADAVSTPVFVSTYSGRRENDAVDEVASSPSSAAVVRSTLSCRLFQATPRTDGPSSLESRLGVANAKAAGTGPSRLASGLGWLGSP